MEIEAVVFWASALVLAYTYVGYPALMWMLSRRRKWSADPARELPHMSIVVVAWNEEERIAQRIRNLLLLEYPRDRLEIVIASDGSTDRTVDLAAAWLDEGIKVVDYASRRGKPSVLNDVIPRLDGEVVVLLDVRQRIEKDALLVLAQDFADPRIGAVSGELMLEDQGSEVGEGVGFYWKYEKFIRTTESRLGSTVGVTGAIYAIRRCLFQRIPVDTILDDVLIPMNIASEGYRVILEPRAHAWDLIAPSAEAEYARKVRTIAGNFQLMFTQPWLLSPFSNRLWFQTLSHKFLRLAGPFCLAAIFLTNIMLLDHGFYQLMFAMQIAFYLIASIGCVGRTGRRHSPLVNVAYSFCLLNWATLVAFFNFISGSQRVTWSRSPA